MNVLVVTTEFPWPPHSGGKARTLGQLELIASSGADITLVSHAEDPTTDAAFRSLEQHVESFGGRLRIVEPVPHAIHLRHRPWPLAKCVLRQLSRNEPFVASKWANAKVKNHIASLLAAQPFDVVYLDHLGMAIYVGMIRKLEPALTIILEAHNVESDFFAQRAAVAHGWRKWPLQHEANTATRFEANAVSGVDHVVAISSLDRDRLAALAKPVSGSQAKISVVAPTADVAQPRSSPSGASPTFGFLGTLSWKPNIDALNWLVVEVWPLVLAAHPDAKLLIAGNGLELDTNGRHVPPSSWLARNVEILGYIADPSGFYERLTGFVCPSRGGSGVRMKIVEAFAQRVPVVTNPDGAYGLEVTDRHELLIAGSAADFAARMLELADDGHLAPSLTAAAAAYVNAHHSREAGLITLLAVLGHSR